jgi:hypothetical protein
MKIWKAVLIVVGVLVLTVSLTYAVMQAVYEVEHVLAVGISNMYSTEGM